MSVSGQNEEGIGGFNDKIECAVLPKGFQMV